MDLKIINSGDIKRQIIPSEMTQLVEQFINEDVYNTINDLIKTPVEEGNIITMITLKVPDAVKPNEYEIFRKRIAFILGTHGYKVDYVKTPDCVYINIKWI